MPNKRPYKKVADAIFGRNSSTVWTVDWWKSAPIYIFWVANDRSGNVLACRALHSLTVSSIVEVLEGAIRDHGVPSGIRTDHGAEFANEEFRRFLDLHDIAHLLSGPSVLNGALVRRITLAAKAARLPRE